jgi:hypothetical protein
MLMALIEPVLCTILAEAGRLSKTYSTTRLIDKINRWYGIASESIYVICGTLIMASTAKSELHFPHFGDRLTTNLEGVNYGKITPLF